MNDIDLRLIGKRINARRKQMNYTQEQIAEKMNVSIQMVSNLERGNKAIRIDNLIKLCEILEVSTDYILLGRADATDSASLYERIKSLSATDRRMIEILVDFCMRKDGKDY